MQEREAGRVAMVTRATGLVGREILAAILADKTYAGSGAWRGPAGIGDNLSKLSYHVLDFAALPALQAVDEGFIALGGRNFLPRYTVQMNIENLITGGANRCHPRFIATEHHWIGERRTWFSGIGQQLLQKTLES